MMPVNRLNCKCFFERIILVLISSILLGRLFIWRLFGNAEVFEKINMSNVAISFLLFIVALVFLVKLLLNKEYLPKTAVNVPILIFLLIAGISIMYSVEKNISLRSFFVLFSFTALFIVLVGCLNTKKRVKMFIKFLIGCGFLVAVLGIVEYIRYFSMNAEIDTNLLSAPQKIIFYMVQKRRVGSLLGWPNVLAAFLMLMIPMSFLFFFIEKNKLQKMFFALATFLMIAAMLFTYSITGWFCFFAALFISILFYKKETKFQKGWISFKAVFIICMLLLVNIIPP